MAEAITKEQAMQAAQLLVDCGFSALAFRGLDFAQAVEEAVDERAREQAAFRLRNWYAEAQGLVALWQS